MHAPTARLRRPGLRGGSCALGLWATVVAGAAAQPVAEDAPPDDGAAFTLQSPGVEAEPAGVEGRAWTLDRRPAGVWGGPEAGPSEPQPEPGVEDGDRQPLADLWMLAGWRPSAALSEPGAELDAHFAFEPGPLGRPYASRADYWARNIYSQDAAQLTFLDAGQEVVTWDLGSGVTFSGVGSRRVLTDRDRGVVLAAEAGLVLSPHLGFQIGYELLQASAGGAVGNDLGGEAVFARFQLRF